MSRSITQDIEFAASPERIYAALTEDSRFRQWTGDKPASIDPNPGGDFQLFDGMISGRTVEAEIGRRLVQAWRVSHWPEGVYSLVSFEIEASGEGSQLHFEQHGHPQNDSDHLAEGWHKMYWEPMKAYLTQ